MAAESVLAAWASRKNIKSAAHRAFGLAGAEAAPRRLALPVSRGGRPVCCVSKRPRGGAVFADDLAAGLTGEVLTPTAVEFFRLALW